MTKDSTVELNEVLSLNILTKIVNQIIRDGGRITQKDAIYRYSGPPSVKESEIRATIEWAIQNNYLHRDLKKPCDLSILSMTGEEVEREFSNNVEIVISIPLLTELGLGRIKTRNKMVETRDAFRRIIRSAQNVLRISSPFFQRNIIEHKGLPEIKSLFLEAFERGCEIRLLSREIFLRRASEFEWIRDFAINQGYPNLLKIYDYHLESPDGGIVSSTHSKMAIADISIAYVGSGEFRMNSLIKNFEIGCLVQGPIVAGLCESFDLMTRYSKVWYNDY